MKEKFDKIRNNRLMKYVLFCFVFILISARRLYIIFNNDCSTISCWDAITQIYPIMIYTRRILVEFFSSIFSGNKFVFPMWEWTLGMGDDVFSGLNWHGFGDPLYLFSVFVPEYYMPYFYAILFYFKVLCGGLAFIALCHEFDKDNNKSNAAYTVSALVYCFTGFTVLSNMHSIFTHAMICIPLLLLGGIRNINGKKRGVLCIATFVFTMCGFFFLYIGSIALAVFVIYNLIIQKYKCCDALKKIFELCIEYIVGIGLAATFLIPSVIGFLNSDRAGTVKKVSFFLSATGVKNYLLNLFLPQINNEQVASLCTIGVVGIVIVFCSRLLIKEKIISIILIILGTMPVINCIMSGFGEAYDRWQLLLCMYFAYMLFIIWDKINEISKLTKLSLIIVGIILLLYGRIVDSFDTYNFIITLKTYLLLLVGIIVIIPVLNKYNFIKYSEYIMLIIAIISINMNWSVVARDREIEYVRERDVARELIDIDEKNFCRIDSERAFGEPRTGMNVPFYLGYGGVSEYVSMENNYYFNAMIKWSIASGHHNNNGFDHRSILETLSSVKYFYQRTETPNIVPYGFEKIGETDDGEWAMYENRYVLPMAYTFDEVYCDLEYEKLNGLQKQQIMLQKAVINDYSGNVSDNREYDNLLNNLDYTIESDSNVTIENGRINANKGDYMICKVDLKKGFENYLLFDSENEAEIFSVDLINDNGYEVSKGDLSKLAINLCSVEKPETRTVKIVFHKAVEFEQDELKFIACDLQNYSNYIEKLNKNVENIIVQRNSFKCDVNNEKDKILCISAPYSKGWKATIDGKHVETMVVNDMFIGIEVPSGKHIIDLKYSSPGMNIAVIISCMSFIICVAYVYIDLKNKK